MDITFFHFSGNPQLVSMLCRLFGKLPRQTGLAHLGSISTLA
jgi:hypothetical protein